MRQWRPALVAEPPIEIETERRAAAKLDAAAGEIAKPQFRPLHVGEDADRPSGVGLDLADRGKSGAMLVMRAMAEIAAEDIDPGVEQRADPGRARTGRAEGRNDLGAALS